MMMRTGRKKASELARFGKFSFVKTIGICFLGILLLYKIDSAGTAKTLSYLPLAVDLTGRLFWIFDKLILFSKSASCQSKVEHISERGVSLLKDLGKVLEKS